MSNVECVQNCSIAYWYGSSGLNNKMFYLDLINDIFVKKKFIYLKYSNIKHENTKKKLIYKNNKINSLVLVLVHLPRKQQ